MAGNFDFLQAEWPMLHAEARKAERDALFDARTTCFYTRRTVELIVKWLYQVESLREPYKSDLAARLHDPAFVSIIGHGLQAKMNLIRKLGNTAVHEARPVPPDAGRKVLTELFHILSWLARTYASQPSSRPSPQQQFDPGLLPKPGGGAAVAKTVAQLKKLESDMAAKDALLEQSEAEKRDLAAQLAARDAEKQTSDLEKASLEQLVEQLQAQIAAAHAASAATPDTHDYDEAQTRRDLIDLLLQESGWPLDQPRDREYPVEGMPDGKNGFVDYVLWGDDGLPLAVVEAKRTSKDPQVGQQQAKLYADCLERSTGQRPIIYYTNGFEHYFWDDTHYPPRPIEGFHTRDELALVVQRRASRKPLGSLEVPNKIAGRPYQERAIRRVTEYFEADNQRAALLVMATGSGKTRTVVALVDLLMRANWVKRVLFLADRKALVKQAVNAFKTHLPDSSPVNLLTEKNTDGRVYVCTYPTMMGLINEVDGGERKFGPGYFDLVVIDEAHRSVYQKYRHIFSYFDSLLLGLTATPKDEIDRNTYSLFNLETGIPTDDYSLEQAIEDKYLVPPRAVTVPLAFPQRGITYDDLSDEEKQQWEGIEWGDDTEEDVIPDGVDAEVVNKWLFNTDTVDKVLEVLMTRGHRVEGGDRLGKTIIFAKNQRHADFIAQRFDANYPQFKGSFARVITHAVEQSQDLIDQFSQAEKDPQIAISVDMLDTGIDVPEVVNLVFFKPVRAKAKFWQMVGRGTRLCPDLYGPGQDKTDFFIFDVCGNFAFFKEYPDASEGAVTASLSQRLFTRRAELVAALGKNDTDAELRSTTADMLHKQVQGMRLDNVIVRAKRRQVERYSDRTEWESLSERKLAEIVENLAGLPTTVRDTDEMAKRFDLMILGSQLAVHYHDDTLPKYRTSIQQIADGLLDEGLNIPKVKEKEPLLREVAGDEWWQDVTLPMLEHARRELRSIVGLLEKKKRTIVYTDFQDTLGDVVEVDMPELRSGTDVERFTAKVRDYLRRQPDNLALQKLRNGKALTPADLVSLEELLARSGAGDPEDLERAVENAKGLGRFIRSLVGLDKQAATEAFAEFLNGKTATASQIDFVNLIISHLTRHGEMDPKLLFESPFTNSAPHGPTEVFGDDQAVRLVQVIRSINDSAEPTEVASA
ncbi:restriction endonuclease subunit R [Rhodococcus sp. WMMA185]|uniref:DEAD/DEAH box helicase family protein n=1 Tax=Rhodococcus sp. WMMA185 TaxID=679318 RepID=UPI0008780F93|nr:DEAD/DEAH box helicase family protein [Rhodococcus sp. WMMA185]AOW94042.1 restriction endonuclease subunit R [Rhodococcus sp. WMMA185]